MAEEAFGREQTEAEIQWIKVWLGCSGGCRRGLPDCGILFPPTAGFATHYLTFFEKS
jgi:hypothetical protein